MTQYERDLLLAILSMDTYHRGYNSGLIGDAKLTSNMVGSATVGVARDDKAAEAIGFYARSYSLDTGETIVAYRGTDNGVFTYDLDQIYGYPLGVGVGDTAQGLMAVAFYRQIAAGLGATDLRQANITVTGRGIAYDLAMRALASAQVMDS